MIAMLSGGNGLTLGLEDEGPGGPECDRRGEFSRGEVWMKSR
jgi:hypothetical protein